MTFPALIALLLAAPAPPPAAVPSTRTTITTYSEHVIIRVPIRRRPTPTPPPQMEWRETRGPRCIDLSAVAGAAITNPASVDFVLRGGVRLRARLKDACPALNYYSGFYLVAPDDGRICADRDAVHARSGGECGITRFRTLKPKH